ncbi:MAG: GWxTD domain-containing protein [bacterium]
MKSRGGLLEFLCFLAIISASTTNLAAQTERSKSHDYLLEAKAFESNGKFKKAEKNYKKALKLNSASIQALRGLSRVALAKQDWGDLKKWNKEILDILPGDLQAKYDLGVAYRESGKFKVFFLRRKDFSTSRKYFDAVILADSAFKDVLYQRAFLERRKENWTEAIEWGHRQIGLKPALVEAQAGLFKFYRLFLINNNDKKIGNWLRSHKNDWAIFALGEQHRRKKRFEQARIVFQALLAKPLTISKIPIYLSLVRMNLQQEKKDEANRYFRMAVDSIKTSLDAEFLFEDSKYIFSDEELDRFRALSTAEGKKEFFRRFWVSRDPTPAAQVNVRALEHFRRMLYAERNYWDDHIRSWFDNPDQVAYLKFPKSYYLNEEFNDRGLIYIRHGEPDDSAVTLAGGITTNQSWLYYAREDRPEYIFHFIGRHWRLAPYIQDRAMLADRLGWDVTLDRLYYSNSQVDFNSLLHQIAIESEDAVYGAMSTDSHTWDKQTRALQTPFYWAFFRGQQNRTRLELYVGIPLRDFGVNKPEKLKELSFEQAAGIYDAQFNQVERKFENVLIAGANAPRIQANYFVQRYIFDLAPDSYNVAFYAKQAESTKIGGDKFDITVPAFVAGSLNMSDLELAYQVEDSEANSPFNNHGLTIMPNPAKEFVLAAPMVLYFEIYNLRKDQDGETSYEIETEMIQLKKKRGGLKKIFKFSSDGQKKLISIKDRRSGRKTDAVEYTSFDVSRLEAGEYELSVKVRDLNAESSVEKSIDLTLRKK